MAVGNSRAGGEGSGVGGKIDLRTSGSRSTPLDMYAGLGDGGPRTSTAALDGPGELRIGLVWSNEGGKTGAETAIIAALTTYSDRDGGMASERADQVAVLLLLLCPTGRSCARCLPTVVVDNDCCVDGEQKRICTSCRLALGLER